MFYFFHPSAITVLASSMPAGLCFFSAAQIYWLLKQYIFSYQLSIIQLSIIQLSIIQLSIIHPSFQFIAFASAAGGLRNCNAAAFASFWKFAAPFSKFRLRRNRTKRGGLCNYWWKCGQKDKEPKMIVWFLIWWMVKVRSANAVVGLIDQQPKLAAYVPVAEIILLQRFACWSKDQHGL